MTPTLKTKPGVVWEVVPEIDAVQDIISMHYVNAKAVAVVTSAHDGNHSLHSAHKQNDPKALSQAIDLRMTTLFPENPIQAGVKSWFERLEKFAWLLCYDCNLYVTGEKVLNGKSGFQRKPMAGRFIILIEKDHFHLEVYYPPALPNLIGFVASQTVYKSKDVLGFMA